MSPSTTLTSRNDVVRFAQTFPATVNTVNLEIKRTELKQRPLRLYQHSRSMAQYIINNLCYDL